MRDPEREAFRIQWLTFEQQEESANSVEKTVPCGALLKGIFGVTDSGSFKFSDYTDVENQNAYFEGYNQQVEETNLFVFNFKGEVIFAAINYPG